jgi:hypothetical protein
MLVTMTTCSVCGGRGALEKSVRVGSGDWAQWVTVNEPCWNCYGTGDEPVRYPVAKPDPPKVGVIKDYYVEGYGLDGRTTAQ